MKVETVKFDKVINASEQNGKINHEPDSSKEQSINAPKKTMPFSDQIGNYQRNKVIPLNDIKIIKYILLGVV